jgi:hypothetical protein
MTVTRLRAGLLVLGSCLLVRCAGDSAGPTYHGDATLAFRADVSATGVATVVVTVSAPDLTTPLVFNFAVASGVASGTVTVPAGSGRTITFGAYDAGGVKTHSGAVTVNAQAGTNPTITIVLTPLSGDLPITVTLGYLTITVTPPSANLGLPGNTHGLQTTAQLAAAINDWNGNPIAGTVTWATSNPGVAVVDASGLVTATGAGSTIISAVFGGATGTAAVSVTP